MNDFGGQRPPSIRVLAALLDQTPEGMLLRQAVRAPTAVSVVRSRAAVREAIHHGTHDVIVFPMLDRGRMPTAPLVSLALRQRPGRPVILLCAAPPSRSHALLAASRAGAHVLVAPTPVDIVSALARSTRLPANAAMPDCEALASVEPAVLRQLLCAASKTVSEDGRVRTLAQHLHVSTRTLSRYTKHARLAPPRALLSAARLLWACAFMELSRYDANAVARNTGFSDQRALIVAIRRHLTPLSPESSAVHLPSYRDALLPVIGSLGGRLAP